MQAVAEERCQPRTVIAAVFQALEPGEQNGFGRAAAGVASDSAHGVGLGFASAVRATIGWGIRRVAASCQRRQRTRKRECTGKFARLSNRRNARDVLIVSGDWPGGEEPSVVTWPIPI